MYILNSIRRTVAIASCKAVTRISKMLGKKGTATPGMIALKIYPDILKDLSCQVKQSTIVVCGTNGKTTTNNMIADLIEKQNKKVICNRIGANMLGGIATAFCQASKINGKINADYACLEIDEASATKVFDHLTPDFMVITNLFRDQLDRYGEIDITINYLRQAIKKSPNVQLLLNGDDPLTAHFGFLSSLSVKYFGIDAPEIYTKKENEEETKEGRYCLVCENLLDYETYYFGQMGKYACSSCRFERPSINYLADHIDLTNGIHFKTHIKNHHFTIDNSYQGFYNIYNMIASIGMLDMIGLPLDKVNQAFIDFKPQIGRMEHFKFDHDIILNLSKNPAGFNQGIDTILNDKRKKSILIVINDNPQDGIDISWLWDVDFHRLIDPSIVAIGVSGQRKEDVALRFKYATEKPVDVKIFDVLSKAIDDQIDKAVDVSYVLVNYTPLFETQEILSTKVLEQNKMEGNND